MSKIINVILSGGSGTRLWPLSRESRPKQFLKIFNSQSLFQHTIDRNKKLVDEFLLITNKHQITEANKQISEVKESFSNLIVEPVGRNTAPAIALMSFMVNPEDILFVTPCDHMITNKDVYKSCFNQAIELAKNDYLVTFGIEPKAPETGFGYIEYNNEDVISFREKPDAKTAKEFLASGNFLWNSGMFCFKAGVFLEELKKYRKDIFESSENAIGTIKNNLVDEKAMLSIPEESVDYAVFEKSSKIKTIPSAFEWTDLGSFDSLVGYFQSYPTQIDHIQKLEGTESNNSYFIGNKKALGIGVSDMIIVDTEDCLLILPKGESQKVKEIYNSVKKTDNRLVK
ncbi:mannose-1-phosphate guanylyltransferase [Aquimarina gracilis]|uniref:Mannose-1-phosphate guanylyltransferase n=1 Tax=Aquimarina gracilis TaxID=874422 RepID=A0ABU6A106_9FLAO|nr:mannose-1-phosphate guanylyltransferase [Aquimarina gracilis]MEB3347750.1 mannose-1-phosphate guanylyltransferase [Aquimarina gracilis]